MRREPGGKSAILPEGSGVSGPGRAGARAGTPWAERLAQDFDTALCGTMLPAAARSPHASKARFDRGGAGA